MICDSCSPASRLFHAEEKLKKNPSSWKIGKSKLDDVVNIRLPVFFFPFFIWGALPYKMAKYFLKSNEKYVGA